LFLAGCAVIPSDDRYRLKPDDPDDAVLGRLDTQAFFFDAVARFNEMLVGTIDAIDTILTAILAGDIAVVMFTIDKFQQLARSQAATTLALLAGSMLACAVGYLARVRGRMQDGIEPRLFVTDATKRYDEALTAAIEDLVVSSEANLVVRFVKRVLAVCGMTLLIGAVVVLAVARFGGKVVH
jgi:hypothetical protein